MANQTEFDVAVVGAGPVGLALAVDLARQGVGTLLIDDNDAVAVGSRAICWAKRTLDIFDRLGVGDAMVEKGVTWKIGRLFRGAHAIDRFDLLPEAGHKNPAFINLQQYHVEAELIRRAATLDGLTLAFRHALTRHEDTGDGVTLHVETPAGDKTFRAQFCVACDGARSPTRARMGLTMAGERFEERFLIADVKMAQSPFETPAPERWFWFHPPFHAGQSALFHKQPDDIYRIDFQLGPDADPAHERQPDVVRPRLEAMLGDRPFSLEWVSVYAFTCARLERFVHGNVIFAGDSAHVVSPFGARGGNGGIQDADNLAWKLAAIVRGAPRALLGTYDEERIHAADENIKNSARATRFMTPKTPTESLFREAVLALSQDTPFAKRLVNSGRLSTPADLAGSSLSGAGVPGAIPVGRPCPDAALGGDHLLAHLGDRFSTLTVGAAARAGVRGHHVHVALPGEPAGPGDFLDADGFVAERYGRDVAILVRPDQHVMATAHTAGALYDAAPNLIQPLL
ncbi:MAG: FAD-dependent monooxygenase [Pseudomonadota bacterium]